MVKWAFVCWKLCHVSSPNQCSEDKSILTFSLRPVILPRWSNTIYLSLKAACFLLHCPHLAARWTAQLLTQPLYWIMSDSQFRFRICRCVNCEVKTFRSEELLTTLKVLSLFRVLCPLEVFLTLFNFIGPEGKPVLQPCKETLPLSLNKLCNQFTAHNTVMDNNTQGLTSSPLTAVWIAGYDILIKSMHMSFFFGLSSHNKNINLLKCWTAGRADCCCLSFEPFDFISESLLLWQLCLAGEMAIFALCGRQAVRRLSLLNPLIATRGGWTD